MIYDCISINNRCFSKTSADGTINFIDALSIISGIKAAEKYFIFRLVDIGPFEAFENYHVLCEMVRSFREINFIPRLLTSGRHFSDATETASHFRELIKLGVAKIILRLDQPTAEVLPEANVLNFVNACIECGIASDILFELDGPIPEALFLLLRLIEQKRFYNDIILRAKAKPNYYKFTPECQIEGLGSRAYRIVITPDGKVLLRGHHRGTTEIEIGSLKIMPLQEIINPNRLGMVTMEVISRC